MPEPRERIPEAVKRLLRQRCGFGCAVCGSPIFDYEHIDGYGITGNDPGRMTLLCPSHHREKTAGRLPLSLVEQANAAPHNRATTLGGSHELFFFGDEFVVDLGTVRFTFALGVESAEGAAIRVDGMTVLGARWESGRILITANIRDADNQPILVVKDGELQHSTEPWDVTFIGKSLIVRQGPGRVILEIQFHAPDRVEVVQAHMWANGIPVFVEPSGEVFFPLTTNVFRGFVAQAGTLGFDLGEAHSPKMGTFLRIADRRQLGGLPQGGIDDLKRWGGDADPIGISVGGTPKALGAWWSSLRGVEPFSASRPFVPVFLEG
jgi:hypothetical protein